MVLFSLTVREVKKLLPLLGILTLFSHCKVEQRIVGLWLVEKVQIGGQTMTPQAKWTRLDPDQSQASGNGWSQHTVGYWQYDPPSKQLSIVNTNGVKDEFSGFTLEAIDGKKMTWSREEDGEPVQVFLRKTNKIPQAASDKLLGVWRPRTGDPAAAREGAPYIFLRWDRVIVSRQKDEKRQYGTYRTHGHRNELQVIYYEEPLRREIWNYAFDAEENLILERMEDGEKIMMRYERIDYIPQ